MSSASGYTNWSHLPAAAKSAAPLSMRTMNPPVISGGLAAGAGSRPTFTRSAPRSIFSISVKNPRKLSARTSPSSSTMNTSAKRVRGA
ncbi:hypothetical protein D3C83_34850 [compost metagenome]